MIDHGPFEMTHDIGQRKVERRARDLLAAAGQMSNRQLAGKPPINASGIEGASVHERSEVSVALQALWNAAIDAKLHPFNIIDGVAHAIATTFAQYPAEARDAGMNLLFGNVQGYEARTRAALTPPERTPDA